MMKNTIHSLAHSLPEIDGHFPPTDTSCIEQCNGSRPLLYEYFVPLRIDRFCSRGLCL